MNSSKQTSGIIKSSRGSSWRDLVTWRNGRKDGWFSPKLTSIVLYRRVSTRIQPKLSPWRKSKLLNPIIKINMIGLILSEYNLQKLTFTSMRRPTRKNGPGWQQFNGWRNVLSIPKTNQTPTTSSEKLSKCLQLFVRPCKRRKTESKATLIFPTMIWKNSN